MVISTELEQNEVSIFLRRWLSGCRLSWRMNVVIERRVNVVERRTMQGKPKTVEKWGSRFRGLSNASEISH